MSRMQGRGVVMMIPPPVIYVAAFVLGLLIERWVPAPAHALFAEGAGIAQALTLAAVVSIALGVVLAPLNAIRFVLRGTTLNPNKPAKVFLTRGIYGVSRNPMYLGLFFIYGGVAILEHTVWPLVTLVIPVVLLDRIIVPFEERQMAERYGRSYEEYRSSVGRWLRLRPSACRERE